MNWAQPGRVGKECARPGACSEVKHFCLTAVLQVTRGTVRGGGPADQQGQVMEGLKPLCSLDLIQENFHNKAHIPLNGIV